jgi:diguanylate cyclase (GGDEF)-like protein/PAS domain S-box-containing protein
VKAPLPDSEPQRLAALRRYAVLDTDAERPFDRITSLAARLLDVPIALVSLIDVDRQWFKACIGSADRETDRDLAFCAHAIMVDEPLVVHDARQDPRFRDNPWVLGAPNVRFYAGAQLRTPSGFNIGTLCVLDTRPRALDSDQLMILQDLAAVVVDELELRVANQERRLAQRIVHTSPDVIYVFDLRTRQITFASKGGGADAPKQEGRDALTQRVHPEDMSRVLAHYDGFAGIPDDSRVELMLRMRNEAGPYRWYLAHEAVFERDELGVPTQVIGVASDVTAMKDIEQALSRSEESLRTQLRILHGVLDSAGDGIVVADEHGELTVFNPAAERLLGAGAARPRPPDWSQTFGLLTAEGHTHFAADQLPIARALRGEATDNVEMLVRNSRAPSGVYVTVTGRPLLDADGSVRGGVVTFTDVTKLKLAQGELARLASLDGLTGVPNHRAFKERLAQLTAEGERGRKFTLVLCDLDHFKELNDTFGHPVGDDVLIGVAQALRSHARATDLVARYGGEEFAVLYTDVDEVVACTLVQRLMRALGQVPSPAPVTASFGVCEYSPLFKGDALAVLAAADQALYKAKHEGRNRLARAHALPMH